MKLERKTKVPDHASGLQEMRAAEGREKVIESNLVRQIGDFYGRHQSLCSFPVQEIVRPNPYIKQIALLHAIAVVRCVSNANYFGAVWFPES